MGGAIEVGTLALADGTPSVAVATDGANYVVCYGPAATQTLSGIDCASVPVAAGNAVSGSSIPAAGFPALAFGPGGFMLALRNAAGSQVQRVDAHGVLLGPLQLIREEVLASAGTNVSIVAVPAGYIATSGADASVSLNRLDPNGQIINKNHIDIFGAVGLYGIASAGDDVGVALISVFGLLNVSIFHPSDALWTPFVSLSPEGEAYTQIAVAGAGGSFGITGLTAMGSIVYRTLTPDGTVTGNQVDVHQVGVADNPHALIAVSDGFLLATTMHAGMDAIDVLHLGCP